jgi:hypothetical protein
MSFLGLGFAEKKHGLVYFTSRTHGMSLRFDWSVHGLNSWIQSFVLRSGTNKATLAAEGFSTIPHLGEKKAAPRIGPQMWRSESNERSSKIPRGVPPRSRLFMNFRGRGRGRAGRRDSDF